MLMIFNKGKMETVSKWIDMNITATGIAKRKFPAG